MPVPIRRTLVAAILLAASVGLAGCATGTAEPGSTAASEPDPAGSSAAPTPEATEGQPITSGPNSLLTPGDGATVAGPTVTVSGDGTAFEGTLLYEVTDAASGDVVAQDYTQAGANGEVGPYEFELTLDPGTYTVRVWEPAMGGEESGDPVNEVSATFTVS